MTVAPPPTRSALAEGWVRHRRAAPARTFRYRVAMVDLDLAEVPRLFRSPWRGHRRPGWTWMRRRDYLTPHDVPLETAARDRAQRLLGWRPQGRVRLITHLRQLGVIFNPVSFYVFVDRDTGHLEAVLAEITNTPWGERHCQAVGAAPGTRRPRVLRTRFAKTFHVSPFLGMDYLYDWRFALRDGRFVVHMQNRREGVRAFDATLLLERRPWTSRSRWRLALVHPWKTWQVPLAIYTQALILWLRRVRFHPHPQRRRPFRANASRPRPRRAPRPRPAGSIAPAAPASAHASPVLPPGISGSPTPRGPGRSTDPRTDRRPT